jgi:hypothetical protein
MMLSSGDLTQMQSDNLSIIDDNDTSIVIRRGANTLAAQTVRVARKSAGSKTDSLGAQENKARVIVAGDTSFDVQPDDRFTNDGILYRVTFVLPNKTAGVVAEAEAVQ